MFFRQPRVTRRRFARLRQQVLHLAATVGQIRVLRDRERDELGALLGRLDRIENRMDGVELALGALVTRPEDRDPLPSEPMDKAI